MPKNETNLTTREIAEHSGTDKTIEKIKSRFFCTNLSKDVKKFVKCFVDQKVKTPRTNCKPKSMPLGPTRTSMMVTMDMAGHGQK